MAHTHPSILIIEDEADLRGCLDEFLQREGYAVFTAANGKEALRKLGIGLKPCVILMDLAMPDMDGAAFRKEQLCYPDVADIPVIAYSGAIDLAEQALQLGAKASFQKPADLTLIIAAVRTHCLK